jgi:hypothetical protein
VNAPPPKGGGLGNDSSRDGGSSRCRSPLKRAKGEGVAPRPRGPLVGTLPPRSETRHHCYGPVCAMYAWMISSGMLPLLWQKESHIQPWRPHKRFRMGGNAANRREERLPCIRWMRRRIMTCGGENSSHGYAPVSYACGG